MQNLQKKCLCGLAHSMEQWEQVCVCVCVACGISVNISFMCCWAGPGSYGWVKEQQQVVEEKNSDRTDLQILAYRCSPISDLTNDKTSVITPVCALHRFWAARHRCRVWAAYSDDWLGLSVSWSWVQSVGQLLVHRLLRSRPVFWLKHPHGSPALCLVLLCIFTSFSQGVGAGTRVTEVPT